MYSYLDFTIFVDPPAQHQLSQIAFPGILAASARWVVLLLQLTRMAFKPSADGFMVASTSTSSADGFMVASISTLFAQLFSELHGA